MKTNCDECNQEVLLSNNPPSVLWVGYCQHCHKTVTVVEGA